MNIQSIKIRQKSSLFLHLFDTSHLITSKKAGSHMFLQHSQQRAQSSKTKKYIYIYIRLTFQTVYEIKYSSVYHYTSSRKTGYTIAQQLKRKLF